MISIKDTIFQKEQYSNNVTPKVVEKITKKEIILSGGIKIENPFIEGCKSTNGYKWDSKTYHISTQELKDQFKKQEIAIAITKVSFVKMDLSVLEKIHELITN